MVVIVTAGKYLWRRLHSCATQASVARLLRTINATSCRVSLVAITTTTNGGKVSSGLSFASIKATPVRVQSKRTFTSSTHQQCLIVPPHVQQQVYKLLKPLRPTVFALRNLCDASNHSADMSPQSKIRQNYHDESEAGVNKQINLELYASYVYQQLAFHFNRDDVALPGFEKFFKESSEEEREHAEKLMKFQNQRGGRIVLQDIPKPVKQDWSSGLEAMEAALELEKTVNQSLLDLHAVASKHNDAQFADFIEQHYLTEQVEAINKLSDYVTNLKRVGPGLGEYLFDKKTLSS